MNMIEQKMGQEKDMVTSYRRVETEQSENDHEINN